jgi:hypothetical protein
MSKKSLNTITFNTVQRTVDRQIELRFSLNKTTNIEAKRGFMLKNKGISEICESNTNQFQIGCRIECFENSSSLFFHFDAFFFKRNKVF